MINPRRAYTFLFATLVLGAVVYLLWSPEKPWDFTEKLTARAEEGKSVPIRWHMAIGLWWGTLSGGTIAAILLACRTYFTAPLDTKAAVLPPTVSPALKKLVIASAAAATLASGILNAPRTNFSLWGDEEATLRKAVLGEFKRDTETGTLEFQPRPWRDTLFNYKSPNNHVAFSVLSRLSHSAFAPAPSTTDPTGRYFSEFAFRLPAVLAGLLAIGAWAWFLTTFGFPRAAIILPWLLILHPWFVRYSTEGRGYALVFFTGAIFLTAALLALRTHRWRWWVLLSLSGFATFYAYPGTVYFLIVSYAAITISAFGHCFRRAILAGAASAIPVLVLMTPLFPQLRSYMERDLAKGAMGFPWLSDAAAYLTTGSAWYPWDPSNPLCSVWGNAPPTIAIPFFIFLFGLTIAGIIRLATASRRSLIFAPIFFLPPLLTYFHNAASGTYLFRWYLLPALPLIIVLWAVGLSAVFKLIPSKRWRDPALLAITLTILAIYGTATHHQRALYRQFPIEPSRDAVALTRKVTNPYFAGYDSSALTASFHMPTPTYDPGARPVGSAGDLQQLITEATEKKLPLHVHFAQPGLARDTSPGVFSLLDDGSLFTQLPPLPGQDEQCTRWIYKLEAP
ncbi:hypothetical protein OAF27_01985 [Verrucomicrobiales bacterium]|nr:hypothetical protein [Verrucomicrobiales bacterium]